MTTDLWYLTILGFFSVAWTTIYPVGLAQIPGGIPWAFGPRDTPMDLPVWLDRARRSHANLVENLTPFAILVIVAHITGKADSTTATGAAIFFWARIVYAFVYTAGIPYLRTLVFITGVVGEVMILMRILA